MDLVATSRFIDIKFKSELNFLTSAKAPLGEIEHYFWQREYQSRVGADLQFFQEGAFKVTKKWISGGK